MKEVVNVIECEQCKSVTEVTTDGIEVCVPFNCSECGSYFI